MSTPKHCPGFESHRDLSSFLCKCPDCGAEQEIFTDEFERKRTCTKCKKPINFTQCVFYAGTEKSASA